MPLRRFRPYLRFLKPVRWHFAGGLLCGLLYAASSGFGLPLVIKYLVPLVTTSEPPTGWALFGVLIAVPVVFVLRALGGFFNSYLIAHTGMFVLEQLRLQVFDRIQELPMAFFQKNKTGDLMSRVLADTQQLQNAIIKIVDSLVKEPATLLSAAGYLVFLAFQDREVGFILFALATVPACVLPIRMVGNRILKKARKAQEQAGQLNSVLNENLSAIREVRAFNLQNRESDRFRIACREFFLRMLKVVKYDKSLSPIIEVVTSAAIIFALYTAITKDIDEGSLASLLAALYLCYQPVKKLGALSNTVRKAEASLDRLEYVLEAEDSVPEPASPEALGRLSGHIRFEGVHFSYGDAPVLRDVSEEIAAGELVALVGPSGAGKSTFANLVPRFYDVVEGTVRVDGRDVRTLSKAELRAQIALVSQDAVLFSESVAENIRLGRPGTSIEQVRAAARMANADAFINELEAGYDTAVGERGARLSGGQRQRISIARAFIKDAPIIILDEPTSALDAESEHQIQAALEELAQGRTVLIIAHRFSTIRNADRILVFDEGRIVATGTHDELYKSNPLYRGLYDKQSTESGQGG